MSFLTHKFCHSIDKSGFLSLAKMEFFAILVSLMMVLSSTKPTRSMSVKTKLNPRIVLTRYGKIQGLTQTFDNSKHLHPIDVYLGIPYATPPIMSNRFSPTRAPSPWDGVKLTDSVGPVCPQKLPDITKEQEALERMPKGRYEYLRRLLPHLQNQSEDCLYLNIYGPAMAKPSSQNQWQISGGSYYQYTGDNFNQSSHR